jgi:hypothetical protein
MATSHKVDPASRNAISSALSFFDIPDTNVSVSSSSVVEFQTLNPVIHAPFNFKIAANQCYFDLSRCYVLVELQIFREDSTKPEGLAVLAADDNVSVCQLIGHTLWKNCKVKINGQQMFESNSLMAYKSLFDFTLSFPQEVKDSYLGLAGYYVDDETSQTSKGGFEKRKALFAGSRVAQLIAKLNIDLCNQPRYLVNQCEVEIELQPNDSDFLIIAPIPADRATDKTYSPPRYRLVVRDCRLYCRKLDLMESVSYDINKELEKKPAIYPLRRTSLRSVFITADHTHFTGPLWTDQVPKRVIIGLVANENFVGKQTSSPFQFNHNKVREITLTASGIRVPAVPYDLDFVNKKFGRAFLDMNEALGFAGTMQTNGISMQRYAEGGCCFFVFNLSSSGEDNGSDTFDLVRAGVTEVKVTFHEPVPAGGIMLVAMGEHESLFLIDKFRTITANGTV